MIGTDLGKSRVQESRMLGSVGATPNEIATRRFPVLVHCDINVVRLRLRDVVVDSRRRTGHWSAVSKWVLTGVRLTMYYPP
jgi:hypothetical protein